MSAINNCNFIGRLTRDPDLRITPQGTSVATFSIAVQKAYNKENQHPESTFINCVAWRQSADFVAKYFKKGDPIAVAGTYDVRKYTDKNNIERIAPEFTLDSVNFVPGAKTSGSSSPKTAPVSDELPDDDLPDDDTPY